MAFYQVELKRVSFITVEVEAQTPDQAEDAAWLELQTGDYDDHDADWSLQSIKEVKV